MLDRGNAVIGLVILDLHRLSDFKTAVVVGVEVQVAFLHLVKIGCCKRIAHRLCTRALKRCAHGERHWLVEARASIEGRFYEAGRHRLALRIHRDETVAAGIDDQCQIEIRLHDMREIGVLPRSSWIEPECMIVELCLNNHMIELARTRQA